METRIVESSLPSSRSRQQIRREFLGLLEDGARIRASGAAKRNPRKLLLSAGYTPRYRVDLFDTTIYLAEVRQNPDIRFFVAYLLQDHAVRGRREIYPRIFYKDISLIWRSASHYIRSKDENWIGKGDIREVEVDGEIRAYSDESTTDLPLEIQTALEDLSRGAGKVRRDDVAVGLVLRRAPDHRTEPYRDFTDPRRRAAANPKNLVNGGRSIARFTRRNDPTSLLFAKGYEPDFRGGIIETSASHSKMYGGPLKRVRISSTNRKVQFLFFAGPRQVWIIPPQATTTELSTFGVRTVDVHCDEDLCLPGFEYHFMDDTEDPPVLFSQIPKGFVGRVSEVDDSRADASPWIDRMPVVRDFRRLVLARL